MLKIKSVSLLLQRDQGINNSCVGWATGYYLRTYQQAKDLGWNIKDEYGFDNLDRVFSPSFIYNQIYIGNDEGAYYEDAYKLMQTQGVASLSDFPVIWGDYQTLPDNETIEKAYPHRIKEFIDIYGINYNPEQAKQMIKEYLSIGELPIMGTYTGYEFQFPGYYNDNYFVKKDDYLGKWGGHAIVVVGYDDKIETPDGIGAFKIINSWSEYWGDYGYAYLTYEAFAAHSSTIGYTIDLVNDEKPLNNIIIDVVVEKLSDTRVRYTWEGVPGATGYRIYDENRKLIEEVVGENEYIEVVEDLNSTTRYIQAFNGIYESDLNGFKVDFTKDDVPSIDQIEYDRKKFNVLKSKYDQPIDKIWNVKFNKDVRYGDYLKEHIFIVDKDKYIQDIDIVLGEDLKSLYIKAKKDYIPGEIYTILIKDVEDNQGIKLKQNVLMDFTVK